MGDSRAAVRLTVEPFDGEGESQRCFGWAAPFCTRHSHSDSFLSSSPPPDRPGLSGRRSSSYSSPPSSLPPSSASQYALVYKGFSLHQDDLLYWQLPAHFTGEKVTKKKLGRSPGGFMEITDSTSPLDLLETPPSPYILLFCPPPLLLPLPSQGYSSPSSIFLIYPL